jgi:hypothetical protein
MFGDWCLLLLDFPFGADCVLIPLHFTAVRAWPHQRFHLRLLLAPADALRGVWSLSWCFVSSFPQVAVFLLLPIISVVFGPFHGVLFRVSIKLQFFHHLFPSFSAGALFADFTSHYLHFTW